MDFQGPLYDVRMSRGQGYNSYIQEPRIHQAVVIKLKAAKSESKEPVTNGTDVKETPGSGAEGAAEPPQPSSIPPNWNDFFPALLDYMSKNSLQAGKAPESTDLPYLKPAPSGKCNQTVLFSSKQVSSITDINRAMGLKASAAVKAASIGPGAELGSNLASTDDFKGKVLNFLVHVKVVNEKPDRDEIWDFQVVEGLEERLRNIKDDMLKDKLVNRYQEHDSHREEGMRKYNAHIAYLRAMEFTKIYGDAIVSDFVEGGEIYALVGIRSRNKAISNDLRAYASAQLTPAPIPLQVKVDTEFTKKAKEEFEQAETSIRIQWHGGGEIKNHNFAWGLDSLIQIANAFPTFVASTSAKIRAVLTPYSSVRSFQALQLKFPEGPLTLNYDRCALFAETLYEDHKAFHSLWDDIGAMLTDPDKYSAREGVKDKNANAAQPVQAPSQLPARTSREIVGSDVGSIFGRQQQQNMIMGPPRAPTFNLTTEVGAAGIVITDLAGILKTKEELKIDFLQPSNTTHLSRLRLLCRSAMLHIQKVAAELVVDPRKSDVGSEDEEGNLPILVQASYPHPGTIRSILPVPKTTGQGSAAQDYSHYQNIEDLHFPDSIKLYPGSKYPDDSRYAWDAYGDTLSDFKKYEHFQIGNFDTTDSEYPQAIAFRSKLASVMGYVNKQVKQDENIISGISLRYWKPPTAFYNDLENRLLTDVKSKEAKAGQSQIAGALYEVCGGKPPVSEKDWTPLPDAAGASPFNRIWWYYKLGSGRVAGLELFRDDEVDGEPDYSSETPVASHKSWHSDGAKLTTTPPAFVAIPGDGVTPGKLWRFAGFVGAFEKVGPLRKERALAKICVVWKKKQDVDAEVDT